MAWPVSVSTVTWAEAMARPELSVRWLVSEPSGTRVTSSRSSVAVPNRTVRSTAWCCAFVGPSKMTLWMPIGRFSNEKLPSAPTVAVGNGASVCTVTRAPGSGCPFAALYTTPRSEAFSGTVACAFWASARSTRRRSPALTVIRLEAVSYSKRLKVTV